MPASGAGPNIITPEAVALELPIAGLGSRVMAAALDGTFQLLALGLGVAVSVTLSDLVPNEAAAILISVAGALVILVGYYLLFEGLWEGQTPGKRIVGLQVLTDAGQPINWRQVVIRTLFRVIDMLPIVGPLFVLFSKRSQRVGDLAAGTIVVRRQKAPTPRALTLAPSSERDLIAQTMDTSGVSDADYMLVRSFLERRTSLTPEARTSLAIKIAETVSSNAGLERTVIGHEAFLEAVIISRRAHQGAGQES